jgi:phosphodiesterase/alkaline phosphatase D-like protein
MRYRRMGVAPGPPCPFLVLPRKYEFSDSAGGLSMNRLLLKLAMSMVVASLFYSTPAAAQVAPTTKKAASVKITQGPEIERADSYLTIVRWTTNNPGGSPEHYGVVHYGTNPKDLSQTAKSPIRLNPGHSDTVFRVRIQGLQPGTTYYYKVDSMEANGKGDGVTSELKTFKTK